MDFIQRRDCSTLLGRHRREPGLRLGRCALQSLIVHDPLRGGISLPSTDLDALISSLQQAETSAGANYGISTSAAALGWHRVSSKSKTIVVILVALSSSGHSASSLNQAAVSASSSSAATVCAGAVASPPTVDVRVKGLPNSHYIRCTRSPTGVYLDGVTTARANIFAMLISSTATMSKSDLEAIAIRQFKTLPTQPVTAGIT